MVEALFHDDTQRDFNWFMRILSWPIKKCTNDVERKNYKKVLEKKCIT